MNKIYILVIIVFAITGSFFFFGKNKTAEVPIVVDNNQTICTMDAKMCPDGTYVARTGPNCEFTTCPEAENNQTVKEFTVKGQNFSFNPSLITVKKGDKVKITFENTSGFHDFKIDEYGVASKQTKSPTTEVLEFTADKIGSFEYYCSIGSHKAMGMLGTLKVE